MARIFLALFFMGPLGLPPAHATYLFAPSISYMEQSYDDGIQSLDSKLTMIDLRFGYVLDMGLYFGGLYSLQDQDLLTDSSDSFFGTSVGYSCECGCFAALTYYLYGEKDFTDGSRKLADVEGFQLDVAYTLPVTDSFRLGPQLTYHHYRFNESQVAGIAQAADVEVRDLTPYFALVFVFE
jgi:hypothetical protein